MTCIKIWVHRKIRITSNVLEKAGLGNYALDTLKLMQTRSFDSRVMYGLELTYIHTSVVCELAAQVQVSDGLITQTVQAESSYGTGSHLPLWLMFLPCLVR